MELKNDELLKLYRGLVLARAFEERMLTLSSTVKLQEHVHSGIGMEAVGIGALTFLRQDDYAMSTHRGYANKIGKGVSLKKMVAEFYGKVEGYCKGKDSHHLTATDVNMLGKWGLIGAQFPIAVGVGLAAKTNGKGQVCVVFFGDGSSARGTFHESMNLVSLWKLPVIWVCENNLYASTTSVKGHTAAESIVAYAATYRIPGYTVDGNDVVAVHQVAQEAVDRARRGEGPSLIDAQTYRVRSHFEGAPDDRPQAEIDEWKRTDPVARFEQQLFERGVLSQDYVKKAKEEVDSEIEEAINFAQAATPLGPEGAFEDLFA